MRDGTGHWRPPRARVSPPAFRASRRWRGISRNIGDCARACKTVRNSLFKAEPGCPRPGLFAHKQILRARLKIHKSPAFARKPPCAEARRSRGNCPRNKPTFRHAEFTPGENLRSIFPDTFLTHSRLFRYHETVSLNPSSKSNLARHPNSLSILPQSTA